MWASSVSLFYDLELRRSNHDIYAHHGGRLTLSMCELAARTALRTIIQLSALLEHRKRVNSVKRSSFYQIDGFCPALILIQFGLVLEQL